jgi:hypothetical protein
MLKNFTAKFRSILFCLFVAIINCALAQQTHFKPDFAPTDAFIKPQEKPYREGICLNGSWKFLPVEHAEKLTQEKIKNPDMPDHFEWEPAAVKVPSPWNVNSFATGDGSGGDFVTYPSYPKKWENIKAGWLMRKLPYHKEWKNKRFILHFDAIGGYAQIYVNKHKAGENLEVFLPFEVDITDLVKENRDNELLIWVADAQLFNQPSKYGRRIYVAGSFWGQHALGLWQDVNLVVKPAVSIQNTFINSSLNTDELIVEATITNSSAKTQKINIGGDIYPWVNLAGNDVIAAPEPKWKTGPKTMSLPNSMVTLMPGASTTVHLKVKADGRLKKWSAEHPNLYSLVMTAKSDTQTVDKQYTRFGWRQFSINGNKFYLNGEPIVLKGDSWHFIGIPQMTRRYAWAWFSLLKKSHANAVRLHAQPYPQFYLDMADEMGICVLDETGMWASDGGPKINSDEYWKNSEIHLKRFILRDRNHPSVFGWSVCNENLPVATGVFHAPDSLVKKQVAEINNWIRIAGELDPSRVWISGDGETQATLNSPVIIGHYGGSEDNYRSLASKGKVWGIGEAGMAYYATPLQTSVYNGNRSFESQLGRMEGVADEATKLINMLKKHHASYMSVFNLVWYGVKPLELGLNDTTRAPKPTDGIFFSDYQEGKPGVQPERLGPYTTTLNPGYDSALPLYKSWPLLNAVSNSFGDTAIIQLKEKAALSNEPVKKPVAAGNVLLLSNDKDSILFKILSEMGIAINREPKKDSGTLLIIDGLHPPVDAASLALNKKTLQQGGNVFIWGVDPASVSMINQYLSKKTALTTRNATSFITQKNDAVLGGLGNADFYFSEIAEKPLMTYGLSGDFISNGNTLLSACNTDWKKWNKRAEYLKTAAVLRSEREYKPAGAALAYENEANGKIYLLAINPDLIYRSGVTTLRKMLINLGVSFQNNTDREISAIGADGSLDNALILASFNESGKSMEEASKLNFPQNTKPEDYFPGQQIDGHFWEKASAQQGVFDLSKSNLNGPATNAVAYLSFWIYSPRSLSNLLLEPDMPKLDMYIGSDNGFQVFMNNKLIKETLNTGIFTKRSQAIKALPLEKGWNHFLIKSIQKNDGWKLAVDFDSDKKAFLNEIKSQITH